MKTEIKMSRIYSILCLFIYLIVLTDSASGQAVIVKNNPALDAIIDQRAEVVKIAEGFQFLEGPVWSPQGYLLFSDIPAKKIYKWDPVNGKSVFCENSGGSNGLTFDADGNLVLCQHGERRIARMKKDGSFEAITDHYDGKRYNSPNDLVIKTDGSVFFTDPPYGLEKGVNDPAKEISFQGVYKYVNGKTILLDSTLQMPNGIAFSPDEKLLYVANYDPKTQAKVWLKYKVNKKGKIGKKTVFADATASLEKGGPDGMKVDVVGNVYCAGPGGILIYSSEGTYLGLIRFPELVANLCFGGDDGKTLYVTARTGLYSVRLKVEGIRPR
jgi:gluconolactonase